MSAASTKLTKHPNLRIGKDHYLVNDVVNTSHIILLKFTTHLTLSVNVICRSRNRTSILLAPYACK